MRAFRFLIVASLCFLLLPGCILSKKLIGETPAECTVAEYAGTWVDSEGERLNVEVINAADGHIRSTKLVQSHEKPTDYFFRKCGDYMIVNLKEGKESPYIVLLAKKSENKLELFIPNTEAFARLIKQGTIKGEIKKDENGNLAYCNIEGIEEPELKKILNGEYGNDLFRWKHPGVYTRVKASE